MFRGGDIDLETEFTGDRDAPHACAARTHVQIDAGHEGKRRVRDVPVGYGLQQRARARSDQGQAGHDVRHVLHRDTGLGEVLVEPPPVPGSQTVGPHQPERVIGPVEPRHVAHQTTRAA